MDPEDTEDACMRTDLSHLPERKREELAEPEELSPETRRRLAQEYFDIWYTQANEFYEDFESNLEKGRLRRAAFNLNQSTESAYKCVLLVHT